MAGIRARGLARTLIVMSVFAAASVAPSLPAGAVTEPVIAWPAETQLNPDTTPYAVSVTYDGPDHLFLVIRHDNATVGVQALEANGDTPVVLPEETDGRFDLAVYQCLATEWAPGQCGDARAWRSIWAYDELVVDLADGARRGPKSANPLVLSPGYDATVDATWEVVPASSPEAEPLAAGTVEDLRIGDPLPPIGGDNDLVGGDQYLYRVTVNGDVGPFGPLAGGGSAPFVWDDRVGVTGLTFDVYDDFLEKTVRDVDVFYPYDEYYRWGQNWRNDLYIDVLPAQHEALPGYSVTITDAAGTVVEQSSRPNLDLIWDGTGDSYGLEPEGIYTVTVDLTDRLGNEATVSKDVRLSHEQIYYHRWRKVVSAKRSMIDRQLGSCASITSPARRDWRGSIGLRSRLRGAGCGTTQAQTAVTVHSIKLPRSPLGHYERYGNLRISAYGGAPRGADRSYLVQYYWSRDKEWVGRSQFRRNIGVHPGRGTTSAIVHGSPDKGAPYLVWSVGLSQGAEYDVRSFTIQAGFYDIGYPGSSG